MRYVTFVAIAVFALATSVQSDEPAEDGGTKLPRAVIERFDGDNDGVLSAQEREKAREALRSSQGGRPLVQGAVRERMMKRFDKDSDGTLNDDEQQEMRRFMSQRRGNGGLTAGERKPRLNQSKLLEKFDEDKDGELDPEERQQVLAELRKRRQE